VDTEADRPVVHVLNGPGDEVRNRRARDVHSLSTSNRAVSYDSIGLVNRGAVQLLVEHVNAHVEGLGYIPLVARANPPGIPVVATTRNNPVDSGFEYQAAIYVGDAVFDIAERGIGVVVISHLCIAAVHRCMEGRRPVVFKRGVDAPCSGPIET